MKKASIKSEDYQKYYRQLILKKIGILCPNPEGIPKCDWIIVDAGSIIVHLFRQEIRDLYSLEKLWDINFDNIKTKLA